MKEFIIKALNFSSLVLIALGLAVLSSSWAKAAETVNYNENYSVSKWRNVRMMVASNAVTPWLSIGPAEWKVTGTMGTSSFNETWSASGWLDSGLSEPYNQNGVNAGWLNFLNHRAEFSVYNSNVPSNINLGAAGAAVGQVIHFLKPSGMYGADYHTKSTSGATDKYYHLTSYPSGWNISGQITN